MSHTPTDTTGFDAVDQVVAALTALPSSLEHLDDASFASELEELRKHEIGEILRAAHAALNRVNVVLEASTDQVDQFLGTTEQMNEATNACAAACAQLDEIVEGLTAAPRRSRVRAR